MNLSHDALKDLTAHPELKAKGDILERHSLLLLKGHAVSDRHDVPSLEGFRMALRVKRMGAWRKESCILVTAQADFYAVFFFQIRFWDSQANRGRFSQSNGAGGALPELARPLPRGTQYKNPLVNLSEPKRCRPKVGHFSHAGQVMIIFRPSMHRGQNSVYASVEADS